MTHPITRASDFTPEEMLRLRRTISAPRLERYVQTCRGNVKAALGLYQWNLEISAAFFLPLQMLEVTVRNAISEAIEATHGPNWTHSPTFAVSLKASRKAFNPRQHLEEMAKRHVIPSKVIADLKFVFWQMMFVAGLDRAVWNPHLRTVFPNVTDSRSVQQIRAEFHDGLEAIRMLRNRVAHHEPIYPRDLGSDLSRISRLIAYRCRDTANWLHRIEQVSALLTCRPETARSAFLANAARKTA